LKSTNIIKVEASIMKTNNTQDEISIGANEYCSNQDLLIPLEINNTTSGILDRSA
jgi:hypothetical protein